MKQHLHLLSFICYLLALSSAIAVNPPSPTTPSAQEKADALRIQIKQQVQMAADGPARVAQAQKYADQAKAAALAKLNDPKVAEVFTVAELNALNALLQ